MKRLFLFLFFITSLFLVSCNNITEEPNSQPPTANHQQPNIQLYATIIQTGEDTKNINYEWTIYYTISPILFKECTLNGIKYTFADNERGLDKEMSGKMMDYCYAEGKYSNNQEIFPIYNDKENRQYTKQEHQEFLQGRMKSRTDEIIKNFKKSIVWE